MNPPPGDLENVRPEQLLLPLRFGATGSRALNVTTPDGQCALYLPEGLVPRTARRGVLSVLPADPEALAPLPDGLVANSNAYQVEVRSFAGRPLGAWTGSAPMVLAASGPSEGIYELVADQWVPRALGPDESVAAGRFRIAGEGAYVLLARKAAPAPASGWASPLLVASVLAAGLALAWVLRRRRRRRISGPAPSG